MKSKQTRFEAVKQIGEEYAGGVLTLEQMEKIVDRIYAESKLEMKAKKIRRARNEAFMRGQRLPFSSQE